MASRHRRLAIVLLLVVVLAGCSGGGLTNSGGDGGAPQAADDPSTAAPASGSGDGGGDAAVQAQQRAVVRTGKVVLRVESFDAARADLVNAVRSRGGYVAGSSEQTHRRGNRSWREGTLVLKVPSESFDAAFEDVKSAGTVRESTSDTTDVTDQLVDVQARLENLRAQRDRLRTLYDEANDTEAVLKVGERLAEVQGRIERLEARQRALEGRVAYATITVRFGEEAPPPETPTSGPAYHETALGSAFFASVDGVVVSVKTLAVTGAYLAPYLAAFGIPLAGLAVAVRRRHDLSLPRRGGDGQE